MKKDKIVVSRYKIIFYKEDLAKGGNKKVFVIRDKYKSIKKAIDAANEIKDHYGGKVSHFEIVVEYTVNTD